MTELAIRDTAAVAAVPRYVPAAVSERDVIDGWIVVMQDVAKLAGYIAETDFVPKALRNKPAAIAACILTGRELSIGPMQSLKSIHMVQGVPSLSAEYKRARALAAGHEIAIDESSATRCIVRGCRAGSNRWVTVTWTIDMARRAKLASKDVWQQYPQRMLQARASSELCDLLFPDAALGLATTEILEDGGALVAAELAEAAADEAPEPTPPAPAAEPAKPRTARRAARTQTAPPASPPSPPAGPVSPVQDAGGALPPLPGEEDPAPAVPTPAAGAHDPGDSDKHRALVGVVQQHFKRLGFGDGRREERLAKAAQIAQIDSLLTLNDLDDEALSALADTLARCKNEDALNALLNAAAPPDERPPARISSGQLSQLRTHYERLGYAHSEEDVRSWLGCLARLAGLPELKSMQHLDQDQAARIIAQLKPLKSGQELVWLLEDGQAARDSAGGEVPDE